MRRGSGHEQRGRVRARAATIQAARAGARRGARFAGVDMLRGVAIAMMIAYHFCYDLAHFGLVPWVPDDMLAESGWIAWRTVIVVSFLALVGFSRALSLAFKPSASDFWKRWAQIAGAAVLVSLASRWFAGERWIYFGILHFIAVAILLCRLWLLRVQSAPVTAAVGLALIVAGLSFSSPALDALPLNVLGFAAHKPHTDDYVPLVPWMGVVLIGLAGGLLWKARDFEPPAALERLRAAVPAALQAALAGAGRWSLTIYLVHQPILIGALSAVVALRGR